jgi:hypothetical protein
MGEPALRVLMAGEKMDGKLPSAVTKNIIVFIMLLS